MKKAVPQGGDEDWGEVPVTTTSEAEAQRRFLRAREWAARQGLMRVEKTTPLGRLVVYEDPVLYLEAFATQEVELDRRSRTSGGATKGRKR